MSELWDIVIDCENQLGWSGPYGMPIWQARKVEVGRLKQAMKNQPQVSTQDLRLAMAWCRRRQEPITSTLTLFTKIDDAKSHQVLAERPSDVAQAHRAAIRWEQEHRDGDSEAWIRRLVRCIGPMRAELLTTWEQAGRG